MITIRVCVGSACHLKGSYDVINKFQSLIDTLNNGSQIQIMGSFCLGHCSNGVSVKLDDGEIYSVTPESAEDFFKEKIIGGALR